MKPKIVGEAETRAPSDFRVKEVKAVDHLKGTIKGAKFEREINLIEEASDSVIELPAHYESIPSKGIIQRRLKIIEDIEKISVEELRNHGINDLGKFVRLQHNMRPMYHLERTPLRHPHNIKYTDKAISEKIAAAIHERITRRK